MGGADVAALAMACAVLVWPPPARRDRLVPNRTRSPVPESSGGRSGVAWLARLRGAVRAAGAALAARRSGRDRGAIEREVVAVVEGLSAALRAGLTPPRAFDQLARATPLHGEGRATQLDSLLAQLAAHAALGGRLEPVLRAAALRLGSPALAAVAAGWGMSERHGAPMVDVLDQLAAALRQSARSAAAIEAALAAPRATAALLGVLPLGGLVLGELVGVDPLGVLFGTSLGRVALAGGLLLTWGGRVWMRRLVSAVERG